MPSQVINDAKPFIRLPFPPTINPHDLITFSNGNCTPSRAPNAFIIYRKLFIKTAKNEGYTLPMTVISSMASKSWEQEPEIVRIEYRRIAKEAFEYRNELFPRAKRGGKRKTWNLISFDHKSDRKNELCKSLNEPLKMQQKVDVPVSFPDFNCPSPVLNPGLFSEFTNYIYPSPDLTVSSEFSSPDINSPLISVENPYINSPIQSDGFSSPDIGEEFEFNPNINSSTISLEKYQTNSPIQAEEYFYSSNTDVYTENSSFIGFFENQLGLGIFESENVSENNRDLQEENITDSSLLNNSSNAFPQLNTDNQSDNTQIPLSDLLYSLDSTPVFNGDLTNSDVADCLFDL
ncbi:158_t:CDS:1, partial [Acaulospora colombiana]